jgi:septal ring factor EnvC (AmiA/AmiB activator)
MKKTLSVQLHERNEEAETLRQSVAELQKKLSNAEATNKRETDANSTLRAEIEQMHSLFDGLIGHETRKSTHAESYYQVSLSLPVRFAIFLSGKRAIAKAE